MNSEREEMADNARIWLEQHYDLAYGELWHSWCDQCGALQLSAKTEESMSEREFGALVFLAGLAAFAITLIIQHWIADPGIVAGIGILIWLSVVGISYRLSTRNQPGQK